jgi:hypothetical protein
MSASCFYAVYHRFTPALLHGCCTSIAIGMDTDVTTKTAFLVSRVRMCTVSFSELRTYRREFERAREQAEQRGAGLWSACPDVAVP